MALAGQGKTKGTVAQLAIPSTCNQSMAAIVPQEMSQARFLFWWLSANYQNIRNMAGGDLRDGLNLELLGDIDCPLVPEPERMTIAKFLDKETEKIDSLINEQSQLISLLNEKRQAVISHAVTKGLNPNTPMKESGTPWLGSIPKHWEILPLKRDLDFLTSGSRGWAEHYSDSGALFIRIGNLTRENISLELSDMQRVAIPDGAEGLRTKVKAGDVLFSITAFLGSVAVVPPDVEDAYVSQHIALARLCRKKLEPRWVAYITLSTVGKTYLEMQGYGGTKIQLGLDDIANLIQVIPPIEEQRRIIQWLDAELSKYESLREQAEFGIRVLKERRTALISAAVTGKIDVRAYMAKPVMSATQYSSGFAHQLLAAEILDRCNSQRMGRIKLQKLIHLCEYHGQVSEVQGDYSRKAAGPFDARAMAGISKNLKKQKWFEEVKEGERYVYRPLEKRGEHKKYLAHWQTEMPRIDEVLSLLGNFKTRECEIVSTLYAAWNDLLIDGRSTDDATILHEASSAERWHKSKEQIAPERWKKALQWMKDKGLVPVGYGKHTRHTAVQIGTTTEEAHEPA
jgi:type I restriction enzyme S subunit